MAKIKKKDLARGVKLTADHWNLNKSQMESVLSGNINNENLSRNNGKFSVTYNWPRLNAEAFAMCSTTPTPTGDIIDPLGIFAVILLPPTQDKWTEVTGVADMPILKSMSISFDTYMNNYAVTSDTLDPSDINNLKPIPDVANKYRVIMEIREKDQSIYNVYAPTSQRGQNIAPKSIYKTEIAGEFFNSPIARFNPYFISGIDKTFNPKKTYLLRISFPDVFGFVETLEQTRERYLPASLTVKLDFETRMVSRDSYDVETNPLQNFPIHQQQGTPTLALDTAVIGLTPTARAGVAGNGRIQHNLETVDQVLLEGVDSGMDIRSNPSIFKHVENDASYFCMAVPMFGGFLDTRSEDLNIDGLPNGPIGTFGGDPANPETQYWKGYLYDQRLIPISQPFTIHHVFAVHDYGSHSVPAEVPFAAWRPRDASGHVPESPTFQEKIGVGIASGIRSESKKYEQIAYIEYTGAAKFSYLVDQIVDGLVPDLYGGATVNSTPGYQCDQEIFQVPLVPNVAGGEGTRSYYDQGFPYFVGKSDLNTKDRTDVGLVSGGVREPNTKGEELYLDVRWFMTDLDPTYGMSWVTDDPVRLPNTQYVGTSKCWVYIIGKMPTAL